MNLSKKNLLFAFMSGLLLTFFMPVIAPSIRLFYFVPFLIIIFYQKSLASCLWFSFICGLIIDLLSVQPPFGFYACNYTLTTMILYSQRRNFFADHLSTLPIMTVLFSLIATLLQVAFLYLSGTTVNIELSWFITDLIIMPLGDALYAFLWFILLPLSLQKQSKRRSSY